MTLWLFPVSILAFPAALWLRVGQGTKQEYLYLLSAGSQALATVVTLVYTVSLVAAQLTARFGYRTARRAFGQENLGKLAAFMYTVFFSLVALYFGGQALLAGTSLVLTAACAMLLLSHFREFGRELNLKLQIKKLALDIGPRVASMRQTDDESIKKDLRDRVLTVVHEIESVAYGAIGTGDTETLRYAVAAEAELAACAGASGHNWTSQSVGYRLSRMMLEAGHSPRAVEAVIEGFVHGVSRQGGHGVVAAYGLVYGAVEDTLAACEWPRQEEVFVAAYGALELLLAEFGRLPDYLQHDVAVICSGWTMDAMRRTLDYAHGSVERPVFGRGAAMRALLRAYSDAAEEFANAGASRAPFVNEAVAHMLELISMQKAEQALGHGAYRAQHDIVWTLTKSSHLLDDERISALLGKTGCGAGPADTAAYDWSHALVAFTNSGKPRLAVLAIDVVAAALGRCNSEWENGYAADAIRRVNGSSRQVVGLVVPQGSPAVVRYVQAVVGKVKSACIGVKELTPLVVDFVRACLTASASVDVAEDIWRAVETLPVSNGPAGNDEAAYCWLLAAACVLSACQRNGTGLASRLTLYSAREHSDPRHAPLSRVFPSVRERSLRELPESVKILDQLRVSLDMCGD